MNKDKRYEIFRRWHEDNPTTVTELNFTCRTRRPGVYS